MSSRFAVSKRPGRGGSLRERRKQQRLNDILEAAFEEFTARGYAATRLEDVGERVSLTKGAIYFYFTDKQELFKEVIRSVVQPAVQRAISLTEGFEGRTEELIRMLMENFYREIVRNRKRRGLLRLLITEGPSFPELTEFYYHEILEPAVRNLQLALKRGVDRGEFRAGSIGDYPQVIVGPAIAAVIWTFLFGKMHPLDFDQYFQAHLDLLMHGLKLRPSK